MLGYGKRGILCFMSNTETRIYNARRDNLLELCEEAKKIDYKNEQSKRDFYFYCLKKRNSGVYYPLDKFKEWFPDMFHSMQAILNKRSIIKEDLVIFKAISKRVVFGSLTFSNNNLKNNEYLMRKKAQRYLDKCLTLYDIVEEHGSLKGRYHVHYLGILKDNITYIDFHNGWEDISYIEAVKSSKKDIKKVSKYLCDYVVKQVPKIRRTKQFTKVKKLYKVYTKLIEHGEDIEASFKWLEIMKACAIEEELPF